MNKRYISSLLKGLRKGLRISLVAMLFGFFSYTVQAQNAQKNTITGKVTSSPDGGTLPGVNISIKGTTTGTSSDLNGGYKLSVPSLTDTLLFSFIGYKTEEVPINGRTEISVKMESKTIEGKEAVVTAFGESVEKQDVVGAVTSFDAAGLNDLRTAPTSNLTTSLAGRVAGLIAFQRSGEPGENNADFFIRGVTTFGYNKNPLILIDDIESTADDLAQLNPDDIASFSILKDATATSLYGSRAANGVLLIKTKTGFQGKPSINVRLANSISAPTQTPKLADPVTYMELYNEATLTRNPLAPLKYSQRKIDKTKDPNSNPYLYPSTDWYASLFKNYTSNQQANINMRGGGNVAQYYVSGAFTQDNGILKIDPRNNFNSNIDLKNYSLRSNVDINLTNSTKVSVKLNGAFQDYIGPLQGGKATYRQAVLADPARFPAVYPVTKDLSYVDYPLFGNYSGGDESLMLNPYAESVKGYKDRQNSNITAQLQLKQDLSAFTKGLKFSGLFNVSRFSQTAIERSYKPYYFEAKTTNIATDSYRLDLLNEDSGSNFLDYNQTGKKVTSSFFLQSRLRYNRTFADKHGISGLVAFTANNRMEDNANSLQTSLPHRNVNFAGRVTYNYDKRYYLELNMGINASERFDKNHRWGYFPSVGTAWNINNEKFWEPLADVVNRFKLRATYGLSGNDAVAGPQDRFLYLSEVNLNNSNRGFYFGQDRGEYSNGISIVRYSNPLITWERAEKINIGMDLSFYKKLDLSVDIYRDNRSNILQSRAGIPASLGLQDNPKANVGKTRSQGIDISTVYNYYRGDWFLQARGNLTYAVSEYINYEEKQFTGAPWKSRVGTSIGEQFGYLADRLFIDDAETQKSPRQNFGAYSGGDIKYRDVNGDGQITTLDQLPLGYPSRPEIVYGFGVSGGYKSIDLSVFFQGLAHESFFIDASEASPTNADKLGTAPFVGNHQLLQVYANDHWSEDNRNLYALWPRLSDNTAAGVNNNDQTNTWFMRNGAFLRVKEIEIGYTLPRSLTNKLSMRKLRIYANGRNLITWSQFDLWDVEMAGFGLGYPNQRIFNLGIKASF